MISFRQILEASTEDVDKAAQQTQHDAPEHDLKRGEYLKGNVLFKGIPLAIETPIGSVRRGEGWETTYTNHYGYIIGSIGNDGDEIDAFLGDDKDSDYVLVVNQFEGRVFDEHKVMLGFSNRAEAEAAYYKHFDDDWPRQAASATDLDGLKEWLVSGNKMEPFTDISYISRSLFNDIFRTRK
ncbi:hypothetical protein NVP1244A_043 [Vibrio phage 1.244.A._10N.261.54.C3]|nr:hypothetical protein NVP1244A_043 [Vibrio phage 1.244.A._10N.261.54.C3]AUR98671.1 hypothetical protein NVP1255O_043 [Vibrio phage 1.255.O._10N.286.45.F1]